MSFLLVKIDSNYQIYNNEHLLIADLFFKITFDDDDTLIITKVASKRSTDEIQYKYSIDYGIITIGRDKNCSISYPNNKLFSKIHTSFYYDKDHLCWFVTDGSHNPSMNGTW